MRLRRRADEAGLARVDATRCKLPSGEKREIEVVDNHWRFAGGPACTGPSRCAEGPRRRAGGPAIGARSETADSLSASGRPTFQAPDVPAREAAGTDAIAPGEDVGRRPRFSCGR